MSDKSNQTNSRPKTILVTGGAGYIGTACVQALCDHGDTVVVFDNLSSGQQDQVDTRATLVVGDMTDQRALRDVFDAHTFDAVLHMAARKSVAEGEENPAVYFSENVGGTHNLLAEMERHHTPTVIFSSTAAVYDPRDGIEQFTEDAPAVGANVYGRTKRIAEECIEAYARSGAIKQYVNLRYFNVAGDVGLAYREHDAKNVFPILAAAAASGTSFPIFGTDYPTRDGTCIRDYIHLADLVDAHLRALDRVHSGTYNIGTSRGYSVRELVAAFEKARGRTMATEDAPRRPGDPAVLLADATRARRDLGWQPTRTLEDMVQRAVSVYGNGHDCT